MSKNLLLIIDPQNDFVDPKGSLYIKDSNKTLNILSEWINNNKNCIDDIIITQDTHLSYHIGHSNFWEGNINPFSNITSQDVKDNKIKLFNDHNRKNIIEYLSNLEKQGRIHTIWPEHCILGSWGWSFPDELTKSLNNWSLSNKGKLYKVFQKGIYPNKEMYSAFSYADSSFNNSGHDLIKLIKNKNYDKIYISGFAKDYCVAYSLQDLMKSKSLKGKLVVLENCTKAIDETSKTLKIYEELVEKSIGSVEKIDRL